MEANVIKKDLMQRRNVYEGNVEIGVESDIVLPDYCGDIERILKCSLVPRLSSKKIEGQRLTIGGTAFLRMVYLTAEGKVESFETQIPFSKSIELQSSGENMSASVTLKTEYSNCRAVSPRRFEARGAVGMRAKVQNMCPVSVVTDIANGNIESKKTTMDAVIPVVSVNESFTVMEEYELSGAPISSVVRMTATPSITEHKIVSGKVILKGDVALAVVYLTEESDQMQSANYTIPVSHILTAEGAEEGDSAELRLEISRMSAEPIGHGDKNEIAIEVMLDASADVSRKEQIEAITDAYCVGFECNLNRSQLPVTILEQTISKTHSMQVTPETDGGEIIDVFAEVQNSGATVNDQGEIMLSADVSVGVLCKNSEGEPYTREKTVPVQFSLAADPAFRDAVCEGNAQVVSARQSSNKNDVGVMIAGNCHVCKTVELPVVTGVDILSDAPITGDPKTAMTIYFAEAGEDTFDIAKRYNTSAKAVMEQNDLTETSIPSARTILIPMVR